MSFFNRLTSLTTLRSKSLLTASNPQHNDFYVVEFPKSGITWLSALLANIALIESGRGETASFTAAHLFVPDIHITRYIAQMPYTNPPVRFIKSHSKYNDNYIFVIYLARHPLSVMKSYFLFNTGMFGKKYSSFSDFCRNRSCGIPAWKRHVRSWFFRPETSQRLHLVRYEDMLESPGQQLKQISDNFGWGINAESVGRAVTICSKDNMVKDEENYRAHNPRYGFKFVDARASLSVSDDTRSYITATCDQELRMLGYIQ